MTLSTEFTGTSVDGGIGAGAAAAGGGSATGSVWAMGAGADSGAWLSAVF